MFRIAIGLLVVAIIAAIFGFGGIASTATGFAKIVFVVALILAVVSFIFGGRGTGAVLALLVGGGVLTATEASKAVTLAGVAPAPVASVELTTQV